MISTLTFRRGSGPVLRVVVVRPNRRRRQGTVRAMRAAGWPWWRIAQVLRVRRELVEQLDMLSALFDAPTLAEIRREAARLEGRAA